jgi:hypothetical protein
MCFPISNLRIAMPVAHKVNRGPANVFGTAVHVMRIATDEETEELDSVIGGGGISAAEAVRRAAKMISGWRQKIAKKGAATYWKK